MQGFINASPVQALYNDHRSYNSFVKSDGKNFGSHMTMLYPNLCYNKVCYKGTVLYTLVWCITMQALYNAMFGVYSNGPCYK